MSSIARVRPRLRQDVVFLETPHGAYVRSADVAFVMKGASAYQWLSSLAPYMTGEHSVAELVDGLDDAQVSTVQSLVGTLVERGLVRDASGDGEQDLPAGVAGRFARQIALVDHFASESHKRFAAFRDARVLLSGDGALLAATGSGLLANGLATLAVHAPGADVTPLERLAGEIAAGGVPAALTLVGAPSLEDLADFDVVVRCCETGSLHDLLEESRRAAEARTPFLGAFAVDGRVLVGPLVEPTSRASLESALLRLSDNGVGRHLWREVALGRAAGEPREALPPLLARMVGNLVAIEVFKHRTGALSPESASAVLVQDVETLETRREVVLEHPVVLARLADTTPDPEAGGEPPEEEEAYRRVSVLVNPHVGVFRLFTDDDLVQIPLKVGRLDAPVLEPAATGGGQVLGFSAGHVMSARLAAVYDAVAAYALQVAALPDDPARPAAGPGPGAGRVAPAALATWTGAAVDVVPRRWAAGRSLPSGEPRAVPWEAVVARPATAATALFEPSTGGVGVAPTLEAATAAALDSALAHDRLRDLAAGRAALVEVSLDDLVAEEDLRVHAASLQDVSDDAWLAEVVGPGGIHVAVGRASAPRGAAAAAGWGRSWAEAVSACLLRLGGRLQCLAGGMRLEDAEALPLADLSLDADLPLREASASRRDEPAQAAGDLHSALHGDGRDAIAVRLTPPDIAAHGVLEVVRVLLTARRESPLSPA